MLPKFALADEMQDLRRRSIAQASQTDPTAQRRNQAQRVSTRETERRSFPLSFAQQRLWVLDRLEPGNGVYNLAFAVRPGGGAGPRCAAKRTGLLVAERQQIRLLALFSFVNAPGIAERAHQFQQLLRLIARNMLISMYNPFY